MKKETRKVTIDFNKLKKMATLKVENREKKTGKTLTHKERHALINRYVENPTIYFQTIPIIRKKTKKSLIKSKRGGRKKTMRERKMCIKCYNGVVKKYYKCLRKCEKKTRKMKKRRKTRRQSKKFRRSKRK